MEEEQWTVVGKGKSKSKQNGDANYSTPMLAIGANRFETLFERTQKSTKSDATKANTKIPRPNVENVKRLLPEHKTSEPKKPVKKSVELAMAELDLQLIADEATKISPGKPVLVMDYVGSWLNNKLKEFPMPSYIHPKKPADYPFRLLSESSQHAFIETARNCDPGSVQKLLAELLGATLDEAKAGKSVWGYQAIAQALALTHPEVFLVNLNKYQAHIIKYKNHATAGQAGLWCLAQAGNCNFTIGLRVWLNLMLPLLGLKNMGQFAVNCLVALMKLGEETGELSSASHSLNIKQYFLILDGVYSNTDFSSDLQRKLKQCYSTLSEIALAPGPKKNLSQFFPSFLTRLSPDNSKVYRAELLSRLTACLEDKASLKAWSKVYENHLVHSRMLLEHITANWPQLCKTIDQKSLVEFLQSCLLKHESLHAPQAHMSQSACQSLVEVVVQNQRLFNFSGSTSSGCGLIFRSMFYLLLLFGVLLTVDVYLHSGYEDSVTRLTLTAVGADIYLDTAGHLASSYLKTTSVYLAKEVPLWIEYILVACGPTLNWIYTYTVESWKYLIVVSQPIREWLAINVPLYIEWVIMHPWWGYMYDYIHQAVDFLRPYATTVLSNLSTYINHAYEFLEQKFF